MDADIEALLPVLAADTATRLQQLEADINAVRKARAEMMAPTQGQGPAVALQEDRTIPGPGGDIPIRVYAPEKRPHGAYLFLHGGGWVLGSHATGDPPLRTLANAAGVAVVSVGYRLAPEHPYPAGLEDCVAAAGWLEENAAALGVEDPTALAIGGESAGANLAVATLLWRRDHMLTPYRAAVLTYGVYSAIYDLPSMKAMWDQGLVLSGPIMEFFSRAYLGERDRKHPYVSPLYADLMGMPPAIFSVGTLDHLYSDTLLMAEAWEKAGALAEVHEYPHAPHGFNNMPLGVAKVANERVYAFLRAHVGSG